MEEIIRNERQIPCCTTNTSGAFPEYVTPFPEPSSAVGLFCHPPPQPTAVISAPPPQKLRPIRPNARNPTAADEQQNDDLEGILGRNCIDEISAAELMKIKSDMDADFIGTFKSQISHLSFSFSSSSDCSGESAHKSEEEPTSNSNGKPKRKKRRKLESFLENLMAHVIQKQEQMHQQLMDLIENKEKERLLREQAWRQQEMDRAKREEEVRSQEAARNLALVSFIRNALGQQDLQIPQPLLDLEQTTDKGGDQDKLDANNKRWPTCEVQALITLRAALDHKFLTQGPKAPVWEQVATGMVNMGYVRSAKKCKEKWDNINKYYKRATDSGKKRSENAKSCPYFHELDTLYSNRLITTSKANSPTCEGETAQENAKP